MINLRLAIRHLRKDKTNTLINVLVLTLGLSIVTVVTVFLINELGYNSSVKKRSRIYRVLNYDENSHKKWTSSPFLLGEYAMEHIPGVESFTHRYGQFNVDIKKADNFINEKGAIGADAAAFDMFSIQFLQGKVSPDFDESENKVFISKSLADKYFKSKNILGKELIIKQNKKEQAMQIAGVFEDTPDNSNFKANMIFNMKFAFKILEISIVSTGDFDLKKEYHSWYCWNLSTNYLLLKENADVKQVEQQLAAIGKEKATNLSLSLQSFDDIYFDSTGLIDNSNLEKGNLNMVYILAVVGLLILLIACVNYLNLSSAQAFMRSRNLSVNRVFGATRKALIWQMITESVLVALISLPLALTIAYHTLPFVSQFLGHSYPLLLGANVKTAIAILITITFIIGTLAGWLVALKITSFKVTEVLKGKNIFSGDSLFIRKATITFQFVVFIVLLVVVIGINKQVNYVMNADMGFVKEGLIRINKGDKNYETYKQEILKSPNVLQVSSALWLPPSNNTMHINHKLDNGEKVSLRGNLVNYDFVKTMGLQIIEGESFNKDKHKSGIIVSKSAAKLLKQGKKELEKVGNWGEITGVVSDFNMSSLHDDASPMILILQPASCGEIAVRVNTENLKSTIDFLESEYNKIEGNSKFSYQFTNDILAEMYKSEVRFSQIIGLLAFIAVFIASLGLFGLSLLMSKQRTKEIGIRRINGASVFEILRLLNTSFLRWVTIAFVIANPIAYYAMTKWLENFAYKTSLSWWIFALAGLSALAIALFTVSFQSWRAARRNPVEALRYE